MLPRSCSLLWKRILTENGPSINRSSFPLRQETRGKISRVYKAPTVYKIRPVVPLELLKPNEPVSGSVEFGDMSEHRKFEWNAESLNARGFLRFQKEYKPPNAAKKTVMAISRSVYPKELSSAKKEELLKFELTDAKLKFEFLTKTFDEFKHSVPNSMLHMMNTVGDVVNFYNTPVKTVTPFDALVRQQDELPPNLHIQKEPIRFHPDTDTLFGGISAFPKSSTIVTGLRSKKKYKGYEAKDSWLKI